MSKRIAARLTVTALEDRTVPSAPKAEFDSYSRILTVTGTEGPDKFYIEQSPRSYKVFVGTTINGEELGAYSDVAGVVVYGLGGNDLINLSYNNTVLGELNTVWVPATLSGGEGNDTIYGGSADDWIDGGAGNDFLGGGAGNDLMAGQKGKDTLYGGAGNDILYGGGGGNDPESGGADKDYLFGEGDNDALWGGGGADDLRGGAGNDALYGGTGNDTLYGGADPDTLFGDAGKDSLYGEEPTKKWGSNWRQNWLESGSAKETAVDGWNAHKPAVDGTKWTDINQEHSSTCVLLSSLAAVTKQGADLSKNVTYLGNFMYQVSFEDGDVKVDVFFDGNYVRRADGGIVDAKSNGKGEFWTIVYQRAYLKYYFDIDPMNGDAVDGFGGEPNGVQSMSAIGGRNVYNVERGDGFTAADAKALRDLLKKKNAVNVGGTGHRYALFDLKMSGTDADKWKVILFNPWAGDEVHDAASGMEFENDGKDDGQITVKWTDFIDYFDEYCYTRL